MSKRRRHGATRRELLAMIDRLEKRIAELEAEVAKAKATATTDAHYVVEKDQQRARAVEEVQRLFEEERE